MKLRNDSVKLVKYYEKLGFSKEQSLVLGVFHYNDWRIHSAMDAYYQSSLKLKGISFCKSVADFMEFIDYGEDEDLDQDFFDLYEFKLHLGSKEENISKEDLLKKFESVPKDRKIERLDSITGSKSSIHYSMPTTIHACYDMETVCCKKVFLDSEPDEEVFEENERELGEVSGYDKSMRSPSAMQDLLEKTRYDKYQQIDEKGFMNVLSNPTSTIRTNCNTASLDIVRENIRKGYSISQSMVRAEELLNYFKFDLKEPEKNKKFGITVKLGDKPNSEHKMMLVGIQGENVLPSRQNIVALLDVSGSMEGNEIPMQLTLMTLISKLNDGDKFSLITYSSDDKTVIDDITFDKKLIDDLIENVLLIDIYGGTYGSNGLNKAYELIDSNKIEDGINRVIIMTDGDFNFGDCSTDSIKKLILEKKKTGAYLSVVGTGTYNTNDELMETLAKNGNGNYCVVNCLGDAEENIYNKYDKLMFTIATDVKAQIEFNPKFIKGYRLIGYENRTLSHDEFRDDKVIAEPFGCGNYCMALYEVEMSDNKSVDSDLKYQKSEVLDSDDLCTLHIRYKNLGEEESIEETTSVLYKNALVENDVDIDMAYVLYVTAERLRRSNYIDKEDISEAKRLLKKLEGDKEYTINDDRIEVVKELMK